MFALMWKHFPHLLQVKGFSLMLQFMSLVVSFVAETFTTVLAQVTKLTLMLFVMVV